MTGYTYLVSPYTHADPVVRHARYMQAVNATAALMDQGRVMFSPIAHTHNIEFYGFIEPKSGAFSKAQDEPLLRHAENVVVLTIPGWQESSGVQWEIGLASELGLPVEYISPEQVGL